MEESLLRKKTHRYRVNVFKKLPDALEEFLKNHPEIKEIEICTDNDFAGRWACEQLKEHYEKEYAVFCNLPPIEGADYGDLAKTGMGKNSRNSEGNVGGEANGRYDQNRIIDTADRNLSSQ